MIEVILNKLMELLGSLNELGKDRRDLKDRALRAVSIALIETKKYYADLERGEERDREVETQIAKYWSAAAIPLRHFDSGLALICEAKGEYWINPENWNGNEMMRISMQLDNVADAYKQLLSPAYKRKNTKNLVHRRML